MKCILLGATRGCGLETLLNLTSMGHTSFVLCRKPSLVEATLAERGITSGSEKRSLIHLVEGDAFQEEDVRNLFTQATVTGPERQKVEFVLFSLGGRPSYANPLSPKLVPPSICTRTMIVFLPVFTSFFPTPSTQPRLVVLSSNGLGHHGYSDIPCSLKPLYGWLLKEPHVDKEEMERMICRGAGIKSVDFNPEGINEQTLGSVVVVRPALLMDGPEKWGPEGEGVRRGDKLQSAFTVSRKDIGRFVVEECLPGNDTWKGKGVVVAY